MDKQFHKILGLEEDLPWTNISAKEILQWTNI